MGKKGIKSKKTKWLTISLSENTVNVTDKNECAHTVSNKFISSGATKPTTAALLANSSIQSASSTTSSIISSSSTTTDTPSTTEKCSSLNNSYHYRSYNNNYHHTNNSHYAPNNYNSTYNSTNSSNNNNHDLPNNGYFEKPTTNNEDRNSTYGSSYNNTYRRRPFRGAFGSRRIPRSYNYSNRTYTNDSEKDEPSTLTPKTTTFNEDEYTRITTPRQDVLFKKGYLSRPKKYQQPTTENLESTTNLMTEDSSTSVSSECGYKSNESPDIDYASMYSPGYVDENGVYIVNPFCMDGYNFYNGPMMMFSPSSNGHCQQHRAMNPMNFYNNIQYMPVDLNDKCFDQTTDTPSQDEMDTKDSDSTQENITKETFKTEHTNGEAETNGDLDKAVVNDAAEQNEAIDEGVDEPLHQSNSLDCNYGYYDIPPTMYPPPYYYPGYVFGQVPFVPIGNINYNETYNDIENEANDEYTKANLKKMNGNKIESKDALDSSGVTSTDFSGDDDSSDCSFGNEVKNCIGNSNGKNEFTIKNQATTTTTSTVPQIVSNLNVEVQEFHPRYTVTVPNGYVGGNTYTKNTNDIQEYRNNTNNFKKFSSQKQPQNVQKPSSVVFATPVVEPPKIEQLPKKIVKKSAAILNKKVLIESTKLFEEQLIDLSQKPQINTQTTNDWNVVGTKGKRKPIKLSSVDVMEEKKVAKSPEKTIPIKNEKELSLLSKPEQATPEKVEVEKKEIKKPVNVEAEDSQTPAAVVKSRKTKTKNKKKPAKRTLILNNMDTFTVIEPDFIVKKFNIKEQFAQVADEEFEIKDKIEVKVELQNDKTIDFEESIVQRVEDFLPDVDEIVNELEKCTEFEEEVLEETVDPIEEPKEEKVLDTFIEEIKVVDEEKLQQETLAEVIEDTIEDAKEQIVEKEIEEINDDVMEGVFEELKEEEEEEEVIEEVVEATRIEIVENNFIKDNCSFLGNEQLATIEESVESDGFDADETEILEEQIVDLKVNEVHIECTDVAKPDDEVTDITDEQTKYPITDAVSKWLTEARKDNMAEPIFVIPDNIEIMGKIKNSISDWLYESYQSDNFDDIDISTDSEIDDNGDDSNAKNGHYVLNNRALKNASNALDTSTDPHENDTDSDYMSDIQIKNGNGKNGGTISNRNSFDDDTAFVDSQPNSNNYKESLTSNSTLKSTENAKKLHSCLIM